jgi:hypothetical protein
MVSPEFYSLCVYSAWRPLGTVSDSSDGDSSVPRRYPSICRPEISSLRRIYFCAMKYHNILTKYEDALDFEISNGGRIRAHKAVTAHFSLPIMSFFAGLMALRLSMVCQGLTPTPIVVRWDDHALSVYDSCCQDPIHKE